MINIVIDDGGSMKLVDIFSEAGPLTGGLRSSSLNMMQRNATPTPGKSQAGGRKRNVMPRDKLIKQVHGPNGVPQQGQQAVATAQQGQPQANSVMNPSSQQPVPQKQQPAAQQGQPVPQKQQPAATAKQGQPAPSNQAQFAQLIKTAQEKTKAINKIIAVIKFDIEKIQNYNKRENLITQLNQLLNNIVLETDNSRVSNALRGLLDSGIDAFGRKMKESRINKFMKALPGQVDQLKKILGQLKQAAGKDPNLLKEYNNYIQGLKSSISRQSPSKNRVNNTGDSNEYAMSGTVNDIENPPPIDSTTTKIVSHIYPDGKTIFFKGKKYVLQGG